MPAIANWSRIVINLNSSSVLLHPIGLSPLYRLLFHNHRNDSWYFRHRSFMATIISVVFVVVFEVDIIVTASVWYSWYVAVLVGFYCIVIIFRSFIPRTSFMLLSHFRLLLSSIVVWWSSDDASAIGCSDMYLSVLALSGLRWHRNAAGGANTGTIVRRSPAWTAGKILGGGGTGKADRHNSRTM